MKCRIQKPIDIPKNAGCLIDIITGKRVSEKKEAEEHIYKFSDYLEPDPYIHKELSKEINEKRLQELLRDL